MQTKKIPLYTFTLKIKVGIIRDEPKLLDDVAETPPNLKEEAGGSIPRCEISSLLDTKNSPSGQLTSCALALAC